MEPGYQVKLIKQQNKKNRKYPNKMIYSEICNEIHNIFNLLVGFINIRGHQFLWI